MAHCPSPSSPEAPGSEYWAFRIEEEGVSLTHPAGAVQVRSVRGWTPPPEVIEVIRPFESTRGGSIEEGTVGCSPAAGCCAVAGGGSGPLWLHPPERTPASPVTARHFT